MLQDLYVAFEGWTERDWGAALAELELEARLDQEYNEYVESEDQDEC